MFQSQTMAYTSDNERNDLYLRQINRSGKSVELFDLDRAQVDKANLLLSSRTNEASRWILYDSFSENLTFNLDSRHNLTSALILKSIVWKII